MEPFEYLSANIGELLRVEIRLDPIRKLAIDVPPKEAELTPRPNVREMVDEELCTFGCRLCLKCLIDCFERE